MGTTIDFNCPECGAPQTIASSLRGGITSCRACRRAVPVPAGFELLWALSLLATLGGAVLAGMFMGSLFGVWAGIGIGLSVMLLAGLFLWGAS